MFTALAVAILAVAGFAACLVAYFQERDPRVPPIRLGDDAPLPDVQRAWRDRQAAEEHAAVDATRRLRDELPWNVRAIKNALRLIVLLLFATVFLLGVIADRIH